MTKKTVVIAIFMLLLIALASSCIFAEQYYGLNASAEYVITDNFITVTYALPQDFEQAGGISIRLKYDSNILKLTDCSFAGFEGVEISAGGLSYEPDSNTPAMDYDACNAKGCIDVSWMKNDASSFSADSSTAMISAVFQTVKSGYADVEIDQLIVCDGSPEGNGNVIAGINVPGYENSWPDIQKKVSFTVKRYVSSISFDPDNSDLWIDYTMQLEPVIEASDDYTEYFNLIYESSDNTVASVSSTGLVTGLSKGTATVKAYIEGYKDVYYDDFTFNVYRQSEYTIVLHSLCNGHYGTALLEGGGSGFLEGETATVSAHEMTGFDFLGWFDSELPDAEPVSTELEYSFIIPKSSSDTEDPGEIVLFAKYDTNQTVNLSVNGSDFTINGSSKTEPYSGTVDYGTPVTLKYTGNDSFIGWRNPSGFYVSRDTEYVIDSLLVSTELTAVTADVYEQEGIYCAYVEFISLYNQLVSSDTWYSTDDAEKTMPSGPSNGIGYKFEGWSLNGTDTVTASDIIGLIDSDTLSIKLIPVYSEIENPVTVRYFRDGELNSEEVVNAGTVMYFTADEIDGKYFSCWSVGGPAESFGIAGTRATYRVLVNRSIDIYSNYADDPENTQADSPYIALTSVYTATGADGQRNLFFDFNRDIPDKYHIIEQGVIRGTSESAFGSGKADQNLRLNTDGTPLFDVIKKTVSGSKVNRGTNQFYLTISDKSVDLVIYARAYALVSDGNNTFYVYSPLAECSYNAIRAAETAGE